MPHPDHAKEHFDSDADGALCNVLGRMTATATGEAQHRFVYDPVGQLVDERMVYAPGPAPLPR